MRTTIAILAGLAVFAAVSVEAAPFSPATMTSAELRSAPAMELIRQGCGWGWHRSCSRKHFSRPADAPSGVLRLDPHARPGFAS